MTDDEAPQGLPEADPTEEPAELAAIRMEQTRICDKCGKRAQRVSSNHIGVTAYCECGHWWAIASRPIGGTLPITPARGLSKETLVEPDWNKAFEDTEGVRNDEIGPKRKG